MNKETPAFVCSHVFDKRSPVLLVSHAEGDWQFVCGGTHDEKELPRVIGLNHLVDGDATLAEVLDLPVDWEAEREARGSRWERRPMV